MSRDDCGNPRSSQINYVCAKCKNFNLRKCPSKYAHLCGVCDGKLYELATTYWSGVSYI